MKIWFTSDFHLNHANIIKYCSRPFSNVEEMNKTIIRNHNERVKSTDTVFFLGDFCFKNSIGGKEGEGLPQKAEHFIKQLNGRIVFIKGNHDRNNSLKTNIERVIIRYGGHRICMIHNPIHADPTYKINLVGHVHEKWKFRKLKLDSYMINVGIDVWNFRPITFDEITKEFNEWKKRETNDERTENKDTEKERF